jgi:hypothetical protein
MAILLSRTLFGVFNHVTQETRNSEVNLAPQASHVVLTLASVDNNSLRIEWRSDEANYRVRLGTYAGVKR